MFNFERYVINAKALAVAYNFIRAMLLRAFFGEICFGFGMRISREQVGASATHGQVKTAATLRRIAKDLRHAKRKKRSHDVAFSLVQTGPQGPTKTSLCFILDPNEEQVIVQFSYVALVF